MISVSDEYRRQLIAGNRNWVIKVPVFLANNSTADPDFTLTNVDIWENGIVLDEAISSDDSFDIGAAIVGSLKVVIDNIKGNFSRYDFYNARLSLWLGVEGDLNNGEQRYYRLGLFVVDTPTYNGSLITLNCFDNMTWFDTPFKEVPNISYPITAGNLVAAICTKVGVQLGTPQFPNYSSNVTKILAKPERDLNCREVLQYVAQMCCCYCKINTTGQLGLYWHDKNAINNLIDYDGGTYNTITTPYSDGDEVKGGRWYWDGDTYVWEDFGQYDGGTFSELKSRVFISQNYEIEVSTDNVVITGVRVRNNSTTDEEKAYDELWVDPTLEETYGRYVLVIENNPLIAKSQAANIANLVGSILAGLPVRGYQATSLADFSYETGDMATVIDFRGNRYYSWITHFTFTTNDSEKLNCGVESVKKRNEQRFTGAVHTLAEADANARDRLSDYDRAVKAMNELAANAIEYNEYVYTSGSGSVMYRYNGADNPSGSNPSFPNSSVVFKISGDGVFISRDHGATYSNGYDANSGTAILNLIYAQGLNADWIVAGTIDASVINVTHINAGHIDTGTMSANYINGGTLDLGGNNNTNGTLLVRNASNTQIGAWTKDGIQIAEGTIKLGGKQSISDAQTGVYIGSDGIGLGANSPFKVTNAGALTASSANITGTIAATSGTIGNDSDSTKRWQIGGTSIRNGCTGLSDTSNAGTYVGTKGIRNNDSSGHYVKITNGTVTANNAEIIGGSIKLESSGDKVYLENGRFATQGYWIQLCQTLSDRDKQHLALGYDNCAFINKNVTPNYQRTVASKWLTEAMYNASQGSDKRLKKKIKDIDIDLSKELIMRSRPISFYYKEDDKVEENMRRGKVYGVIAQEIREVLDDLGETDAYLEHTMYDEEDHRKVEYKEFIPHLINMVKSQQEEIDLLKQEVALLKEKVGV